MTGGTIKYSRTYFYAVAKSPGKEDIYCPTFHPSKNAVYRCWEKMKKTYPGHTIEVRARSSMRPMEDMALTPTMEQFEERYSRAGLRKKVSRENRHKRYTNLKHTGGEE